jgi:sterol desaturase/sphingolipid hydroxylase (fatty acid hydroxylase superfamily)
MDSLLVHLGQVQTLVMLAALVVLLIWESIHPFFDFFRHDRSERGWHALRNLLLGGLNALLIAIVFVSLWLATSEWAANERIGLLHSLSDHLGLPPWVHAIGALLLIDGWTYLWHRLNHKVPFLWRFHRVHHADTHMDVTTASRFHIGEIFFSSLLRIPLIAVLGLYLWELLLYETLMFTVAQFHHANIVLPERIDRALRLLIVTPAVHKVHHSCLRPETDSNYSALFSFWDRIGRSFRLCEDPSTIRFGLDRPARREQQTFTGLLKEPFLDDSPDPQHHEQQVRP